MQKLLLHNLQDISDKFEEDPTCESALSRFSVIVPFMYDFYTFYHGIALIFS